MSHNNNIANFESKYIPEPNSGCWLWTAYSPNGRYGAMNWGGRRKLAHVIAYEIYRGPVAEGVELDHLCKNTFCVNPEHLEPVTHLENVRRNKFATATYCKYGHAYADGFEIYIRNDIHGKQYRRCLTCYRTRYPGTLK